MCHAHPRYHPCNHTSMSWFFCATASCDLKQGTSEPCSDTRLGLDQSVKMDCPLKACKFKQKGPEWICCLCHQGPNTKGWCTMPKGGDRWSSSAHGNNDVTTCDHGCCEDCIAISQYTS
ncbi:hypothetical protein NLU13_7971 [Sarocladium strictum]|uniref:Uncharacterized protein n=1 Tax=Sarocladium strictum TaxID=5046 RepID=A0AA39GBE3_SARSR|nr:hypothetical protein NLU13_7971 [Sarocladium strictum]